MSVYSRSLSAVILLVSKDPLFHARHNTEFFKLCEQSTELHFDSLEQQLEDNAESVDLLFCYFHYSFLDAF